MIALSSHTHTHTKKGEKKKKSVCREDPVGRPSIARSEHFDECTLVFEGTISNYSRNELTEERPVNDSYLDLEIGENGGPFDLHCMSFPASPSSPC